MYDGWPVFDFDLCVSVCMQVAVWAEGCYLNNFVQGVLDTFPQEELKGSTLVVSGDGR